MSGAGPCRSVTERVALGEPLAELAEHVATCASCRQLVALPERLAAASHAADPGLGFSARMTVAARHRIAARHRRRTAGVLAATVAAGVVGVFAMTRAPSEPQHPAALDLPTRPAERPVVLDESDLADLIRLADTKRARRASAPWGRIQKPLTPYMKLVKGVTP